MNYIAHHKFASNRDEDYLTHRAAQRPVAVREAVQLRPAQLAAAPHAHLTDAGLAHHLGRPDLVRRFLDLAAETGAIACAAAFRTGDVGFVFQGEHLVGPGDIPQIGIGPQNWKLSFDIVTGGRRADVASSVVEYPEEYLRRADGERDEYTFTAVETHRAFAQGKPAWQGLAEKTEREMERASIAPARYIVLDRARIAVLRAIASGDVGTLDSAMVGLLKAHKAIFGRGQESKGAGSLLCMPALALGAMAFDRGIETTVESDYMPRWLLRGEEPPA